MEGLFTIGRGSILAQGQRQVIELIDDNIPALEKSHLLMLLAGFIIGMQHRSRIATPALFIGKGDDGRHREGGKRRGDNPPSASRS